MRRKPFACFEYVMIVCGNGCIDINAAQVPPEHWFCTWKPSTSSTGSENIPKHTLSLHFSNPSQTSPAYRPTKKTYPSPSPFQPILIQPYSSYSSMFLRPGRDGRTSQGQQRTPAHYLAHSHPARPRSRIIMHVDALGTRVVRHVQP